VAAQAPGAGLALAPTCDSRGLPGLLVSCRHRRAAKEHGSFEQSERYYKENGNFSKSCGRRKASRSAGSATCAYICREKNFLILKEL